MQREGVAQGEKADAQREVAEKRSGGREGPRPKLKFTKRSSGHTKAEANISAAEATKTMAAQALRLLG